MGAYDEKAKNRTLKYLKTLKSIQLRVKPEYHEKVMTAAKNNNMTMRSYVIAAINEKMEKEIK